jgi:uncharacterized protein (TIGR02466 family)
MSDLRVNCIFPVVVCDVDLGRDFTEEELKFVSEQKQKTIPNTLNRTSENTFVLNSDEMTDIRQFCLLHASKYFHEVLKVHPGTSLYITQSWLNFSENYQGHHVHSHPNSIVSGVFYFESDENDKIKFHREYDSDPFPKTEYDIINAETWWFPAVKGKLMLFSSKTVHSVDIRESNVSRTSLSFNTYFKGPIGHPLHLNYLKL